jgi:hypothetical protein
MKEILLDIIGHGSPLPKGKERRTFYALVEIDGYKVRLPITGKMEKEIYNTTKLKLTIEIH